MRRDAGGETQRSELIVGAAIVSGHGRTVDANLPTVKSRLAAVSDTRYVPPGTSMNTVTVEVPATTSNIGPGYDCLGIALGLANQITITRANDGPPPLSMARKAADAFFVRAGTTPFAFTCKIGGDVPISRGLGSSVTLRMGTIVGLNALAGEPLSREAVFEICAALEGHPDNAAPAAFGGFTVAGGEEDTKPFRFPVDPRLRFVLLIPDFEVRTADSRRILPEEVCSKCSPFG